MVLSSQTNRVYFSRLLSADYKPLYEKMTGALHQHGIETGLLEGTKDYWCRDYMPIRITSRPQNGKTIRLILPNRCLI